MIYGKRGAYEPFYMLWVNGEELAQNIMKNIVQWSYEDHEDKLDELRFTILDTDLTLQESGQLQKSAKVLCLWGYVGGRQEKRLCNIEEIEYTLPENGVPQIIVKALDTGAELVKRKARACYNGVTGAEVLEEIAKKHNLKTRIHILEDFKMEFVSQGGKSDFDFMKETAIERGCNAWIENDTLIAEPYALSESALVLAYKKDIISLRAKYKGAQGQGTRENVEFAGMEPALKETVQEFSASPASSEYDDAGRIVSSSEDSVKAKSKAKQKSKRAQMQGWEADVRILGNPAMQSKQTVTLEKCGNVLNGDWRISSVRHDISASGYPCSLKLVRPEKAAAAANTVPPSGNGGASDTVNTG